MNVSTPFFKVIFFLNIKKVLFLPKKEINENKLSQNAFMVVIGVVTIVIDGIFL